MNRVISMEHNKFARMRNGYHRFQVDDYIENQQKELDWLRKESQFYQTELIRLKDSYDLLSSAYASLQEDLKMKEQAASELTRIAMKEANCIVDTAQQNADAIVLEAITQARGILMEITRFGTQTNNLKKNMKDELLRLELVLDEIESPMIPTVTYLEKEKG